MIKTMFFYTTKAYQSVKMHIRPLAVACCSFLSAKLQKWILSDLRNVYNTQTPSNDKNDYYFKMMMLSLFLLPVASSSKAHVEVCFLLLLFCKTVD